MGNQVCCQVATNQQKFQQDNNNYSQINYVQIQKVQHNIPELTDQIKKRLLAINNPFQTQYQSQQNIIKKFGNDTYQGPLDAIGRPTKIGKMFKDNNAYFIGNFANGKAQGQCLYIMKEGTYYLGNMKDNKAEDQNGKFVTNQLEYFGGFKNNQFHGKGGQKNIKTDYSFDGIYQNGLKKQGIMQWVDKNQKFIYEGQFDQNQKFTKKGKLTDFNGRYQGQFQNGMKNGNGTYYYKTKLKYIGHYVNNKKQGLGQLLNHDNSLAYKGIFKNGLPNGKGTGVTQNGVQFQTEWKQGIDIRLL